MIHNNVGKMIKCPTCGNHYDTVIHNWCPNCRKTYNPGEYTAPYNHIHHNVVLEDDAWEVKIDVINNCAKSPEKIKVKINPIVKSKIDYLMKKFIGTEWLAYLIGDADTEEKKAEENKVIDIFLPNQVVNSVNVDNIHCEEFNNLNIIGVIHSHHNMGNNFSSTDDDWINQNHNISLCVSKSGIKGHVRWKTPCGSYKIVEAKLVLNLNTNFDEKSFDEEIEKKIEKKTYTNYVYKYNKNVRSNVNGVRPNVVNNNPGSYHFTEKPTLVKNDNINVINDDEHLTEEDILEVGEDLYKELVKDMEFDMKDI